MEFWPIFDIFHGLRPYLCSKQDEVGFHKQPTHRRRDDEPFFYSGVDRSWLGMAQKWSILDQKWPNMAGLSTLQSGPKGPKRDQNGQPKSFWTFGTLLGPSGPFWTISNKNWYFAPKHLCKTLFCPFGAKKSFLSEMVQKGPDGPKRGPKWSKRLRLTILVPFGPLWSVDKPAMLGHFWAIPSHERWTQSKKKTHHRVIYVWPACGTPK